MIHHPLLKATGLLVHRLLSYFTPPLHPRNPRMNGENDQINPRINGKTSPKNPRTNGEILLCTDLKLNQSLR